ncbi:hypothetical protein NHP194003_02220 [Helicobacter suis]|nr:hypothetical protein NHP194003_02220 [Helicobacter suis]
MSANIGGIAIGKVTTSRLFKNLCKITTEECVVILGDASTDPLNLIGNFCDVSRSKTVIFFTIGDIKAPFRIKTHQSIKTAAV